MRQVISIPLRDGGTLSTCSLPLNLLKLLAFSLIAGMACTLLLCVDKLKTQNEMVFMEELNYCSDID